MKGTVLFVLFIVPVLLQAQQHSPVNWAAAPKNPVPFAYTSNHYGYTGKVKSLTEEWGSMSIVRTFDENGLQQTGVSKIAGTVTSSFIYKPELQQLVKIQEEGSAKVSFTQLFNEKKQVVSSASSAAQQYTFVYNSKGLLTEKRFAAGNTVTKYMYNDAGQLVKEEMYRDTVLTVVYTYRYKSANNLLEVNCSTLYKTSNTQYNDKEFYNAAGMLVKEITADEERTHQYQLDAAGNWTLKKTTFKSLTSKSLIVKDSKRTIEYW